MAAKAISIVIPAYKAEKTIAQTVSSCFTDPRVAVEVIVVEDGVFDNTRDVIEALELPVKLLTLEQNSGAQVARNLGFEQTTHECVMFLDSDDYIESPLLYELIAALDEQALDVVLGAMTTIDEKQNVLSQFIPPAGETRLEVAERWLRGYSFPHPCGIVWRASFVREIGGWNEKIKRNQDGEIMLRAMMNRARIGTVQEGMSYYLDHSGPRVSKGKSIATYDSQELVLELVKQWLAKETIALKPAIAEFCALVAAKAFNDGHNDISKKWQARINEFGGLKVRGFHLGGRKRTLRLLSYKFLGIKTAERLRQRLGM